MERRITMSNILITLTPMGKFFFGGDMRFGIGNESHDKQYYSYIIHSSMMPQQTSLLGMLRFLLLSNNEDLFDSRANHIKAGKKTQADELIGEKSFWVDKKHEKGEFGLIQDIGPCFLYKEGKAYFRSPADENELNVKFPSKEKKDDNESPIIEAYINKKKVVIPSIKCKDEDGRKWVDYTGKHFVEYSYASSEEDSIKEDELFIKDIRIGINKSYAGKVEDSAFFKQISYRLKEGFRFAFTARIKMDMKEVQERYDGKLVTLGADSSAFVLNVYSEDKIPAFPKNNDDCKIVLLSDAYLLSDDLEKVIYGITDARPFRFLHASNNEDSKNYNIVHNMNCQKDKFVFLCEKRYDLFKAGSVFYFEKKEDTKTFIEKIEFFKEFRQIGYNQYR